MSQLDIEWTHKRRSRTECPTHRKDEMQRPQRRRTWVLQDLLLFQPASTPQPDLSIQEGNSFFTTSLNLPGTVVKAIGPGVLHA